MIESNMKRIITLTSIILLMLCACSDPQERLMQAKSICSENSEVLFQLKTDSINISDLFVIIDNDTLKIIQTDKSGFITKCITYNNICKIQKK